MVATFFALAEQHNVLAVIGEPAEAVGTVAIVRIGGAVEQARTQEPERRLERGCEGDLAGQMHGAVHAGRRGRRSFREWQRPVGIDRIRADIEHMRDWYARQCVDHGLGHDHVVNHHADVPAGGARGNRDNRVAGTQEFRQTVRRGRRLEIDILAGETKRGGARQCEAAHQRTADEAGGADDDRAFRQGRGRIEMAQHAYPARMSAAGAGRPSV